MILFKNMFYKTKSTRTSIYLNVNQNYSAISKAFAQGEQLFYCLNYIYR